MGTTCSRASANGGVVDLIAAASSGDTKRCLDILKDRPDFMCRSQMAGVGNTAMHAAVAHVHCLEAIISCAEAEAAAAASASGAQLCKVQRCLSRVLDVTNGHGQTPLMLACRGGHPEAVRLLLVKGADPWCVDKLGSRTALHHAALSGQAVCVKALLTTVRKTSRYIDTRTVCGFSPLHCAVAVGSLEAVRALLAHSPNIYACNVFPPPHFRVHCPMQTTVLHMAAIGGNRAIVLELLKFFLERSAVVDMNDPRRLQDGEHRLPYQVAEARGHHDLVQLLHPSQRLLGEVFRPDQLKMLPGIPTLGMLAASALRVRLMTTLDDLARAAAGLAEKTNGHEGGAGGTGMMSPTKGAGARQGAVPRVSIASGGAGKRNSKAGGGSGAEAVRALGVGMVEPGVSGGGSSMSSGGRVGGDERRQQQRSTVELLRQEGDGGGDGGVTGRVQSATCLALPRPMAEERTSGGSRLLRGGTFDRSESSLETRSSRPAVTCPSPRLSPRPAAAAAATVASGGGLPRRASLDLLAAAFEEDEDERASDSGGGSLQRRSNASAGSSELTMDGEGNPAAVATPRGSGESSQANEACGICLDHRQSVAVSGCGHCMCRRCARALTRQMHDRVNPCPFCRRPIGGFQEIIQEDHLDA